MTVLAISSEQYHADELGDRPSLSASIAKVLIGQSPRHAFEQHPRLNPNYQRKTEDKFDVGTVAHQVLLEGKNAVEIIYHDNYTTNAAKADRKAARDAGKIPLLDKHWAEVQAMCEAVREQIDGLGLFDAGKPEQTLVWDEEGVACRCRVDWLRNDATAATDLKTTGTSAKPSAWTRFVLFAMGYDIQAALYRRGIRAVTGIDAVWRWCVVETKPPYVVSVIEPDAETLAVGDAKVSAALEIWQDCLDSGVWPGYASEITTVSPLPWETRWLNNDLEETAWAQMG